MSARRCFQPICSVKSLVTINPALQKPKSTTAVPCNNDLVQRTRQNCLRDGSIFQHSTSVAACSMSSNNIDGDDETILAGDLIQFNIAITNTGNVDLIDLTLEDTLKDGSGDTILTDGSALLPTLFSGSDQDSPRGSLKVGETATYLAYYLISPEVASTGSIHNQVLAKAKIPGTSSGFDVEVLSDDGIVETPTDNTTTDVYITADPIHRGDQRIHIFR